MRRGVSLGLFGLWTLVAAGVVSADDDADEKVSVSDTIISAPPEAEKAYRKPSYEPLRGFKLLDPVDPKSNPYSLTVTGNM